MMTSKHPRAIACVFILIVAILWVLFELVSYYPGVATPDTLRQLNEGVSEVYTNWKPTLYSWQLGMLERWFPGHGPGAAYVLQIMGFAVAVGAISWFYTRYSVYYSLLVLVLPLLFTVKCMLITTVGNDEQAAVCYLLYIAGILVASSMRTGGRRILLLLVAWSILGYGMVMRHNALPAVFLLGCWGWWRTGVRSWWRIGLNSVVCVLAALAINSGVSYYVLKAEASYPLRSPLVDDIVNLSIMEGEWHPVVREFYEGELLPPYQQCVYAPESGNWNSPINPYILYSSVVDRKRDYELLKAAWWEMVQEHPARYFVTKIFFFHQYLLEGRCIPWLCEVMREAYPHMRIHMEKESGQWRAWVNREFVAMSLLPLGCYIFLFFCVKKQVRQWVKADAVRTDALCFIGAAFIYTSTFVLLVLSATEARYYIIRATLCGVGAAMLILSCFIRKKSRLNPC